MSHTKEKSWTTTAGFRAVVLLTDMGHRCGYVGLPETHPLYGAKYGDAHPAVIPPAGDEAVGERGILALLCASEPGALQRPEVAFNVHGGITYAGGGKDAKYPEEGSLWWFGFDCAHHGDTPSRCDLAFCEAQCELLAGQMVSRVKG